MVVIAFCSLAFLVYDLIAVRLTELLATRVAVTSRIIDQARQKKFFVCFVCFVCVCRHLAHHRPGAPGIQCVWGAPALRPAAGVVMLSNRAGLFSSAQIPPV